MTQQLAGMTGANVPTISTVLGNDSSGGWLGPEAASVGLTGLIVYYTGTAPPANTNTMVVPPLYYNPSLNTLGITLDRLLAESAACPAGWFACRWRLLSPELHSAGD